jgi:hypothetical protein
VTKEIAVKLLMKAMEDFKTAEKLLSFPDDEIIAGSVCFHCQQFVENADVFYTPSINEAKDSFAAAETIKNFILNKLGITENELKDNQK